MGRGCAHTIYITLAASNQMQGFKSQPGLVSGISIMHRAFVRSPIRPFHLLVERSALLFVVLRRLLVSH